ncbi:MAG: hypothetical protein DRJ37_05685 [Thermoprotei archaeon]|nr:MAG: hypothetical protein DRJ37_05685 [Thermoprotei archaeon]
MSDSLASWFKLLRWGPLRRLIYGIIYAFEILLVRHFVNRVFTVSVMGNMLFRRYKQAKDKVAVVRNVPEAEIPIDEDLKRELLRKYAGHKLVIYVGAVNRSRGCLAMVKAMEKVRDRVPNAKLLLVGPVTEEEFMKEALEFIGEHELEEHVEFVGLVPYSKIHTYLCVSDVAVALYQPDLQYMMTHDPTKVFLYMRAGVPVVASDFPGMRAVMEEVKCGLLVDPTDVDAIARAIITLLEDAELAKRLGENGRRAILSKYNITLEGEKVLNAYEEALGRRLKRC